VDLDYMGAFAFEISFPNELVVKLGRRNFISAQQTGNLSF
jgi:hypothetical protein